MLTIKSKTAPVTSAGPVPRRQAIVGIMHIPVMANGKRTVSAENINTEIEMARAIVLLRVNIKTIPAQMVNAAVMLTAIRVA